MGKKNNPPVTFRGKEFVMVQKAPEGYRPGSVVLVDANQDGEFEFESVVGSDGIWAMSFEFVPIRTNKDGQAVGVISWYMQNRDGSSKSDISRFEAVQISLENPAKAIPVNCATAEPDNPIIGFDYRIEGGICTCDSCTEKAMLLTSSTEGFNNSFMAQEYGVETASGKYRSEYFITAFDTRRLDFNFNLHQATMVKYPGPLGESFSHSYNMMIVQTAELTGQVITPDLRIFEIFSENGVDWHLPDGFNARLCVNPQAKRWELIHFSGISIAFYQAMIGCPGYPISISDPNGNTSCMTYDGSGYLQDITTDLEQVQSFDYDANGYLSSYTDHIGRRWNFPHDGEGRLSAIETPATRFANIGTGQQIGDFNLDEVLVKQGRCWVFSYQDNNYPNQISAETDPRGATYRQNIFDDKGRVASARINGNDVVFTYDEIQLPLDIEKLEAGNIIRSITDREGNVHYHEIHGFDGGAVNQLGRFGLRRSITLTESGKGNERLRDDEPQYWEQRWLHDCDCLNPLVVTQMFSSDDLANLQFDQYGIAQNYPREEFNYNKFHQKTGWIYTDGTESISKKWTYQTDAYGDNNQFSRPLTETDAREFDDNPIYAGVNLIHSHGYDDFGNHTRHDAPLVSLGTDTPQKITERWTYNEFGQLLLQVDANGNITAYAYFEGNSVGGNINTQGRFGGYLKSMARGANGSRDAVTNLTRKYKVNALGMITLEKDENGFAYTSIYNELQEVVCETAPPVTLFNGLKVQYKTRYVFDGAGNTVLEQRSNIDLDGSIPKNAWIDRSASFDDVGNQLTQRVEVDENDANDLITRYAYDNNDDQIATQKPANNRAFTVYDERRLPFKVFYGVDASAAESLDPIFSGYPSDKRAVSLVRTPFVGFTTNSYDARFNRVRVRDGRGNTEHHIFDFYNREIAYADQNGNGWVQEFDAASNVITESHGAVSKSSGQITQLLERRYFRFDEVGRQIQQVLDIDLNSDESQLLNPDDGFNSSYLSFYDAGSRLTRNLDANANANSVTYDAADRVLANTDALGNQQLNTYDANSNTLTITELELPDPASSGDKESYVTTFNYDELNRQTQQHDRGRNGDSIDHAWFFAYDSRGNQRLVQDAENNFTLTRFDDLDRQTRMQRFDGNPIGGSPTELLHYQWAYDRNSNLSEERALADVSNLNSLQITLHAFDSLDRPIRTVYPDSDDPIDGSNNGPDRRYDRVETLYDENSNPIQVTDQRQVVFNTRFDPGNRPVDQNISLPDLVPGTSRQSFNYDALNRTLTAKNNYATIDRMYDPLSRITSETQAIALDGRGFDQGWEQPIQVNHNYDRQSNCTDYQVLDGSNTDLVVNTSYDPLNRGDTVSAAYFGKSVQPIASYRYIGPARIQKKTLGNGAILDCGYDSKRRLQSHFWSGPKRFLAGFEYAYSRMDNALFERFIHDLGLCDHFQYNNRYEVTGVSYRVPGSVPKATPENIFAYDDNFNRKQASFGNPFDKTATTNDSYVINRGNEYTRLTRNGNTTSPAHDRSGNAVSFLVRPVSSDPDQQDVTATASWDAYNLMFSIDTGDVNPQQDYRYDPMGRRIATLELTGDSIGSGSRRYIYQWWSVVEERLFDEASTLDTAPSSLERIYVNGMDIDEPLLAAIDGNQNGELGGSSEKNTPSENADKEYYYLNNRLGSIMALLDADNPDRVLEYYRYSLYGEPCVLPVFDNDGDGLEDSPLDLSDNVARQVQPGQ